MSATLNNKLLYISVALNALAVQFIWIHHIPPWFKRGFAPAEKVEYEGEDLSSLTSVYGHLNKILMEPIGGQELSGGGVPTHRLQLALATYIVKSNQEFWLYWQEDEEEFLNRTVAVNVTDLEELRERLQLTDWAYLESTAELEQNLHQQGYVLLRHDTAVIKATSTPGVDTISLGHFLAFHPQQKEFIICLEGMSTAFADLIANLMGSATQDFELPNNPYTGENTTYPIHAPTGMMNAALHLVEEQILPILEHLILPREDYKIVVQGHSQAGGCAALLGVALRGYLPAFRDRIQVYAFGPPAVLDQANALASRPFITSVLNRADIVPRISFLSAQILMNLLVHINRKLEEVHIAPQDYTSTVKLTQKLLTSGKASFFATDHELYDMIKDAMDKVDETNSSSLVPPGRTVILYEKEVDRTYTATGSMIVSNETKTHPKVKVIQVEKTLLLDHRRSAYLQSLTEAIRDAQDPTSSSKKSKRKTSKRKTNVHPAKPSVPLLKRVRIYVKAKIEDFEYSFSPTTHLDSNFMALVIALFLLWKRRREAATTDDHHHHSDDASTNTTNNKPRAVAARPVPSGTNQKAREILTRPVPSKSKFQFSPELAGSFAPKRY